MAREGEERGGGGEMVRWVKKEGDRRRKERGREERGGEERGGKEGVGITRNSQ